MPRPRRGVPAAIGTGVARSSCNEAALRPRRRTDPQRSLGLRVPEIVFADLHPDLARTEPDREIFALIKDSAGLNLALDYLPGSVTFDPLADSPAADFASRVVWFDALVTNVDRTARNTNI